MAWLSFLMTYWEWIVVCVVAVIALGYAAFILKNWKVAACAVAIVCCGLAYQSADNAGYNRRVAQDVATQTQIYKERIDALNTLALKEAFQSNKDQEKTDALNHEASNTPANSSPCFDLDTARRVRSIGWNGTNTGKPTAAHPGGHSKLFSPGSWLHPRQGSDGG